MSAEIQIKDPKVLRACMSADDQAMLRSYAEKATSVLEFGIGGSTGIFAEYEHLHLTGIDSHPDWIAHCNADPRIAALEAKGQLSLHHVDIGPVREWGFPADPATARKWPRYSLDIWQKLGSQEPDMVFVDGRFRLSCALQSLLRLPDLKYLSMHDFWNREHYFPILDFVTVLDRTDHLGVFAPRPDMDLRALGILASQQLLDPR